MPAEAHQTSFSVEGSRTTRLSRGLRPVLAPAGVGVQGVRRRVHARWVGKAHTISTGMAEAAAVLTRVGGQGAAGDDVCALLMLQRLRAGGVRVCVRAGGGCALSQPDSQQACGDPGWARARGKQQFIVDTVLLYTLDTEPAEVEQTFRTFSYNSATVRFLWTAFGLRPTS